MQTGLEEGCERENAWQVAEVNLMYLSNNPAQGGWFYEWAD
jgi:hypothetical protein